MKIKNKRSAFVLFALATALAVALAAVPSATVSAAGGETGYVEWKYNFGGMNSDYFFGITTAPDGGFVAAGWSWETSFGNGDWVGSSGNGDGDATIVKFKADNTVEWAKNFGGDDFDLFRDVKATSDGGFVAVGYSNSGSFGTGDWSGIPGKGGYDATIVKFDADGGVVWAKNFGGAESDYFERVAETDDGFIAVGDSSGGSFGNSDWLSISGKGETDAIIVKFDTDGGVVWATNFGGEDYNQFFGITATSDGEFIAVGVSSEDSFGTGDLTGVTGKGEFDAIIVKFDADGGLVWAKNFGGESYEQFNGIAATSDGGFVAIGYSEEDSFGNGDWTGVMGYGNGDAFVVKYKGDGTVEWAKNFGGTDFENFSSIKETSDGGFIVVGASRSVSFGTNDWSNIITTKGWFDAIIMKLDAGGGVVWAKNFGGESDDFFYVVTIVSDDEFVITGNSYDPSFGTGDWEGFTDKGGWDNAIVVKYRIMFSVDEIIMASSSATAGKPFTLNGTVTPSDATYKTITWSIKNAGATGATLSGNILSTTGAGTVVVTATIDNGLDMGIPYTKDFTINVKADVVNTFVPVNDITLGKTSMTAGTLLTLSGTVTPSNATHKDIVWSISGNGATGATLSGNTLSATGWGTVVVTATITDGKAVGTPFMKDFTITVDDPEEGNGGDNGNGGGTDTGDSNSDEDANTDLLLIAAVAAAIVVFSMIILAALFRRRKKDNA